MVYKTLRFILRTVILGLPSRSTSTDPKDKDKSETQDSMREGFETVVFVVVLVLLLKTFVAEAFVIPTGSMAETLYGYQKIVTCEKCKFLFPVNCSSEVDPQDRPKTAITGCLCPNCEHAMTGFTPGNPDWSSGDRVLVGKYPFDRGYLTKPERHQVLVFKFPDGPQKNLTAMNYIKRVVALEHETVAIFGTDLYVAKKLEYPPKPDVKPEDLWRIENVYRNDDKALRLFAESMNRRIADQPAEGFEIVRKAPKVMMEVRRIVFNNDHQPGDLANQAKRWNGESRWTANDPKTPVTFAHPPGEAGEETQWLRYSHRSHRGRYERGQDDRVRYYGNFVGPENPPGFETDPRRLISNLMGYNTGEGDGNREVQSPYWVGDLMLECTLDVTGSTGVVVLELSEGYDRFQARFDVSKGTCTLVRRSGKNPKTATETNLTQPTETKLKGPGKYKVRFANFDDRLTLWVDGKLPFKDGVEYPPSRERGPTGENDLEPASVGAAGAAVSVSNLQLWRDTCYTFKDRIAGPPGLGDTYVEIQKGKLEHIATYYIYPGHYFCLGDNSSSSLDSRYWGLVPERLLLGRAVMVYYPFWPFGDRFGLIR